MRKWLRGLVAGAAALLGATQASAQSSPGFIFGQVPTAAQWNAAFQAKQNWLGANPCILTGCIMTGKLVTVASTTTAAGFNLPPGAAPTSPVNGDLWTTTAGLYVRIAGSTVGPLVSAATVSLTVGTTPITGGTTTRVLYDNAGVLGEYTISGTGSVAMTTSPSFVTPTLGTAVGTSLALGGATLGGNALAVTGTSLFNNAVTMSAALTYGGVTLSNAVTGTGAMVLGTSPSIASLTVTGAFTATGLVTNADLANPSTTVNGQTCTLGSTCTITAVATTITVGTTTVGSGTTTRILYDNAGTLGEYTVSGSGTVVAMQTGAALITPALGVATGTSLALGGCTISTNALCATGTANISGATTIGGALTYGGVALSNAVTGTGNMVLSAGATLTGTVTASGTLNASGTFQIGGVAVSTSVSTTQYAAVKIDNTTITLNGSNQLVASGAAAGSVAIGTTTISGGTTNRIFYDNAGVLGELIIGSGLSNSSGTLITTEPNFKVTLTSNQSVTSATWTKVNFDTVVLDVGSYWDAGNHYYKPLIAGTYLFCLNPSVSGTFTFGADDFDTSLSKNGLTGGAGTRVATTTNSTGTGNGNFTNSMCTLVAMNGSTDTIEGDVFVTATSPAVIGNANLISTFSGYRVSP